MSALSAPPIANNRATDTGPAQLLVKKTSGSRGPLKRGYSLANVSSRVEAVAKALATQLT
jgi:hypothetical protein